MSEKIKKAVKPSCSAIAMRRARHARSRSRARTIFPVRGWIAFISALISSFAASALSFFLMASLRWKPAAGAVLDWDRPPNAREHGHWGRVPIPLHRRLEPSLQMLVKRLQRPSRQAREHALADILARVTDPETRAWLEQRAIAGDFHRIQYAARAGIKEKAVLAGWAHEAATAKLEAEKEAEEAKEPDPKPGPKP